MRIAVALSGGVDSLVAAHRLKIRGFPIVGVHFRTGYEALRHARSNKTQAAEEALRPDAIQDISEQLDIPVHIIDCRREFEKIVVDYFIKTYRSGKTPNPCVLCNRAIKFGTALEAAEKLGATHLATGHYVRMEYMNNRPCLIQGEDGNKDQSYFLSMLSHKQLSRAVFPLGLLSKDQVRRIARENGLRPASSTESQDVCFIQDATYADFLERKAGIRSIPGDIVDPAGNVLGRHQGLHRYTVGQRRGIKCPAEKPYYVLGIDLENNRLVVGFKNSLYRNECHISKVNWLIPKPKTPLAVNAHLRYRHRGAEAIIEPLADNSARIRFKHAQPAITPGQTAVCYIDDAVAAAGWIEEE